jgi:hypothetical protein
MATLSVGGTTVFDGSALQSGVTGTIGTGVTFPTGHMRFLAESDMQSSNNVQASTNIITTLATGTFTAGSRIWMHFHIAGVYSDSTGATYGQGYLSGESASTGTKADSGVGYLNAGPQVIQEFGYQWSAQTQTGYAIAQIITPINGATSASYNIYYSETADGRTLWFYRMKMSLWEVF